MECDFSSVRVTKSQLYYEMHYSNEVLQYMDFSLREIDLIHSTFGFPEFRILPSFKTALEEIAEIIFSYLMKAMQQPFV